jgi:hypothetical protein
VRYEELVTGPEDVLRRLCGHAGLAYEPAMLEYAGTVDLSQKPHQQSLARRPTPGLRSWREQMAPADAARFEQVAGDLLADLGYGATRRPDAWGLARRADYAARTAAYRAASLAVRRSPRWRSTHPYVC